MALNLEGKKAIVAQVQEAAESALSAVVADSRGVNVSDITALRKEAREAGVWMKVVRNTLAKRAVEGSDFECLSDSLVGPSLIAFSSEHPGAAARIFSDFAKKNDKFELKSAAFEGNVVDVEMLAKLPTYDEAIARLMMTMKEAAAGKLCRTIAAIRDQKEEQAA
jgi:large subunit ribosomal protein L10